MHEKLFYKTKIFRTREYMFGFMFIFLSSSRLTHLLHKNLSSLFGTGVSFPLYFTRRDTYFYLPEKLFSLYDAT